MIFKLQNILLFFLSLTISLNMLNAQDTNFKVGVSLALTGPLAEYGQAAKNGILLAQKKKPDLFKNIKFIFEDDSYLAKNAISNFKKFKSIDKVDLVYSWGVEPSTSLSQLAEKTKSHLLLNLN